MKIPSLRIICALGLAFCLGGCGAAPAAMAKMPAEIVQKNEPRDGEAEIYLAGGCFWGTERYLSLAPGVISAESGYANGRTARP
ncbi:peptide-methionine (S)-S-oxide reductase, partial [uncultured Selenomonas sp.]